MRHPRDVARPRRPRCPTCGQPTIWTGNGARPFCSVACKLIDLGEWLDEVFRVPGESCVPEAGRPPARTTEDPCFAEERG